MEKYFHILISIADRSVVVSQCCSVLTLESLITTRYFPVLHSRALWAPCSDLEKRYTQQIDQACAITQVLLFFTQTCLSAVQASLRVSVLKQLRRGSNFTASLFNLELIPFCTKIVENILTATGFFIWPNKLYCWVLNMYLVPNY